MNLKSTSFPDSQSRMSIIDQTIFELRVLFEQDYKAREGLQGIIHLAQPPAFRENFELYGEQIDRLYTQIQDRLQNLLLVPPHHSRHHGKLEAFHRVANYEESIFIMTKFPEGATEDDKALKRVIDAVSNSIEDCGFYPRLASDKDYHPLLWDNVELYLLGCSKGVAIVEDRYMPELNPNVAMEWGWMRGMGKEVLYLVENDFEHFRADWLGLLEYRFSWDEPEDDIKQAIEKWLKANGSSEPVDLSTSPQLF